ncbi:class I SAM-dependent methyltransferase [Aspergillus homomorphus CBS 101889]|uniref:S-adenosyl-L-methionine dependent methyltransferase n=1 Tax=Aspergillus homomorphus (strain CBS 101889) TaxID=1450537 RepID=A0A395HHY9_ASPHC|nr:hypothetical protein BO97DRAFT_418652 [Aspergillus homomorphus CBS 101889]RAL07360.1 hypothetical protein BO97DRAFT_418652 [Aspergillus homomorphus CBS 101889]
MSEGYDCYTRTVLWMYDVQVHWFNDNFAWRCPRSVLQAFFDANAGPRHMDIGPGTGLFLADHRDKMKKKGVDWPEQLAFVDMNPNCLQAATARVGVPARTSCVKANVFEPFTIPPSKAIPASNAKFDSIALMYVLHCLPPPSQRKAQIFQHLKQHLTPNGTLFGATVLGKRASHNWVGQATIWFYNWNGIFGNLEDDADDFVKALKEEFDVVEANVVGVVLLFRATGPKVK